MTKADILAYSNTNIRVKTDPSSVSTDNVATSIDNCAENFANADLTADDDRTHEFGANTLVIHATADVDHVSQIYFNKDEVYFDSFSDSDDGNLVVSPSSCAMGNEDGDGANTCYISTSSTRAQVQKHTVSKDTLLDIATVDPADDFLNDGAAAGGGVPVNGLYHTSGVVKIRLS